MTTPARRRLLRDFKRITQDAPTGIIASPDKDDLLNWQAVIFGPEDTPWEGGTFKLQLKFLEEYPNRPPVVKFITKLFHPNIYTDGAICLDILANQWSPIYDVAAILASIQSLLTDPNPNSPANVEAAKLYVENRREYDRKVSEVIESLWKLEEEEEEEEEENAAASEEEEAAPRKKQKLTETSPNNSACSSSTIAASTTSAASPASSSSLAAAAPASSSAAAALAASSSQSSSSSSSQPPAAQ